MKKEEINIGLEIHIPLNTKTKLFCACKVESIRVPNKNVCEICLGFPGSKPRLNGIAVEKALKLALSLDCEIGKEVIFSRKTYFYPDLSKNFQITQYERPLGFNGKLRISGKNIRIRRLQLEEDPGSLQHKENYSLVDYNRSGVALVEVVSEPDFKSSKEVIEFMQRLFDILKYLDIYNPQDFSVRADVNVSIGDNERVEIKNVSGMKNIDKAISFEIIRQKSLLKKGDTIKLRTVHFDEETGKTFLSREKESEADYGYILEPDLPILRFDEKFVEKIRKDIPEIPYKRFERLKKKHNLSDFEAYVITGEKEIADLFEELSLVVDKDYLKNWIVGSLRKVLNYNDKKLVETGIKKKQIEKLVKKIVRGELTFRAGEFVLRELVKKPGDIEKIVKRLGLVAVSIKDVEKVVLVVIRKNKKVVQDYKNGKEKALHFLIGKVIREIGGSVDAKEVIKILKKKIK